MKKIILGLILGNKVKYVPASSSVDLLDEYVNSLK
ncbi:hypothetical protein SK3146_01926 [Paenibacillus konkukensis]|uniref:Uncharacterized protein n=1 Tax=Paenibacillus konkukensis TaxID=2020716 RepID=A0ABY4RLL4_9BACL|nr:hypothetical protein SK3146_01926 [Paenibacillus konkukensis]